MTDRPRSLQQLDPVGIHSGRPVTLAVCIGLIVYPIAATIVTWHPRDNVIFAIAAILAICAASFGIAYWSNALRAPFPAGAAVAILVLAGVAMSLSAASTAWDAPHSSTSWGALMLGLVIMQLAPYRPPSRLFVATIIAGLTAALIASLESAQEVSFGPRVQAIIAAVVPLVALGFGGAAYSAALGKDLATVRAREIAESRQASDELRDTVATVVQDDRRSILDADVVPYLESLVQRSSVTEDDRREAARISATIRAAMVADVQRSWLDEVVEGAARRTGHNSGAEAVQDDEDRAALMTSEQRIAVRALVDALHQHPGFDPDGFGIVVVADGDGTRFILRARLDSDDSFTRSGLAPYLALLRMIFVDLHVSFQLPDLGLRFSYE